jgi:hypothetical protein
VSTLHRLAPRLLPHRQLACWLMLAAFLAPAAQAGTTRDAEPRWEQLTMAERQVLQPLEREWPSIEPARKLKWRELATQYPRLDPERQTLLRSRMAAWARMSPTERSAARVRYEEAKRLPEAERQARWKAYQALSEERRKALADKALVRLQAASAPAPQRVTEAQPKTNIVPPNTGTQAHHTVSPGTVRAAVGASTRPISERPTPPLHQQPGLPKITATPGFVDSSTLLPQRGPQGAAAMPPERQSP